MKFFSVPAILSLAVAGAAAETCVLTELATTLTSVIAPATACQTATGYTILPPSAMPTAAQISSICSQCQTLITAAKGVTFPSCTLAIGGTEIAIDTLFNSIVGQCSGSSNGSSSGSSATVTVVATETPSTSSGSSDTTIDTVGSTTSDTDITSPSTTTTTTPSTTTATPSTSTSAAVSAVQTVGMAVVVVAATATTMLL